MDERKDSGEGARKELGAHTSCGDGADTVHQGGQDNLEVHLQM